MNVRRFFARCRIFGLCMVILSGITSARASAQNETPVDADEREEAVGLVIDGVEFHPSISYVHLFFNAPRIRITSGGNAGSGTDVSSDDLDSEDEDTFRAALDVTISGDHRVHLAYMPMTFEGSSTVDDPFVFHGMTIAANDRVRSAIDLDLFTFGYDYRVYERSNLDFRIGARGYVWDFSMEVDNRTTNTSTDRGFSFLLPALTTSTEWRFARNWHADLDIGGGWFGEGKWVADVGVTVGVKVFERMTIDIGYRFFDLSLHESTNRGEFEAHALWLGVGVTF